MAAPTSGQAPLSVSVTDAFTGDITLRQWNFGDGGNLTCDEPVPLFRRQPDGHGHGGSDTETKIRPQ